MFEHFTKPAEIFNYKLGSALTMEHDSIELLREMEKTAMRSDVKDLLQGYGRQTPQQVQNLEQCFAVLGKPAHQAPSPSSKGMAKELKALIGKVDTTLVDSVVLAAALESAHYETAVYESLLSYATARGAKAVAELLKQNLDQEQALIQKIKAAIDTVAHADAQAQEEAAAEQAATASQSDIVVPDYLPRELI